MRSFRRRCSLSAVGAALGLSIACTDYESSLDRGPAAPPSTPGPVDSRGVRRTPGVARPSAPARVEEAPDAALPSGATTSDDPAGTGGDAGGDAAPPSSSSPEAPDAARADCLDGTLVAGSCYRVSTTARTWAEGRADCLAWGGDLVSIQSTEEDSFIASLLPVSIWIGASDQGTDGVFTWADGTVIGFGNWGTGQPDAAPGPDCVEKRQEAGEPWYDQPCSNAQLYVCERELTP